MLARHCCIRMAICGFESGISPAALCIAAVFRRIVISCTAGPTIASTRPPRSASVSALITVCDSRVSITPRHITSRRRRRNHHGIIIIAMCDVRRCTTTGRPESELVGRGSLAAWGVQCSWVETV